MAAISEATLEAVIHPREQGFKKCRAVESFRILAYPDNIVNVDFGFFQKCLSM